tara:strand:- start:7 stop:435 length:429 start_codon:yes stop_codon:yes gene_type:complete
MGISKYKIKVDYQHDYYGVGISTSANAHRTCYLINKALKIQLTRNDVEEELGHIYESDFPFIAYKYESEEYRFKLLLIKNKNEEGYFMKSCKEADFLLLVKEHQDAPINSDIIANLNKLDLIQLAYFIDLNKLKGGLKLSIE